MKFEEPLGFHGVALPSRDPDRDARACSSVLGLPILRRSRAEVVLGLGPELFIAFFRVGEGSSRSIEVHLAVKGLSARAALADELGGDSATVRAGEANLIVREFCRSPSGRWSKKRRRRPAPPGGRGGRR